MRYKTTFIGHELPFPEAIKEHSNLHLIVCKRIKCKAKKFFASSFDYAKANGIQIISPQDYFNNPIPTDIIIVFGYPKLIPSRVITHPRIGILNIHQSLLPAYRSRHPLNWAIINAEKYTGVTIHHINGKFDEGDIIFQKRVKIEEEDTIMDVYSKTVEAAKELIRKTLNIVGKKQFKGFKQKERLASYFPPRRPKDGRINWNDSAIKIKNLIRALTEPYPGVYFYYKGKKTIIDEAKVLENCPYSGRIGKPFVFDGNVIVKTGEGFLNILKIREELDTSKLFI